jgi:RimJ/RimL family protein N-acetyltransferase
MQCDCMVPTVDARQAQNMNNVRKDLLGVDPSGKSIGRPEVGYPVGSSLRVPTLPAPPFRVRPFETTDFELVREASGDPLIPLISPNPTVCSVSEAVAFIERQWSHARLGHGFSFVIADAVTDRGVGAVGLTLRSIGESPPSVGYWVVKSARGRGAATHALRAVTTWALNDLQLPRLELFVPPSNMASIVTAERSGFRREGLLRAWLRNGEDRRDMFIYARLCGDRV